MSVAGMGCAVGGCAGLSGGVDEGACRSAGMGDEWVSWFAGVMCGWVVGDVGGCGNGGGWDGMCFRWVCGCEWSAGVGDVSG